MLNTLDQERVANMFSQVPIRSKWAFRIPGIAVLAVVLIAGGCVSGNGHGGGTGGSPSLAAGVASVGDFSSGQ